MRVLICGTLWEWSWKEGEEGFNWHQEDQNIKAIIDDIIYVKNDNTTWSRYSNKQIADFGATDVVEGSAQDSYDLKVATSNVETLPVTVNFLVEPYPLTITSPKSLPLL